jgi:hypothetical protein
VLDLSGGGMRKFDNSRILAIFGRENIELAECHTKYNKSHRLRDGF